MGSSSFVRARARRLLSAGVAIAVGAVGLGAFVASDRAEATTFVTDVVGAGDEYPGGPWAADPGIPNPGSHAFVAGPATPPSGVGSLSMTIATGQHEWFTTYALGCVDSPTTCNATGNMVPLSSIDAFGFWTYRQSGTSTPTLLAQIAPNGTNAPGDYTALVFVPNGPSVVNGTWQHWNGLAPADGVWYSTVNLGSAPFACAPFSCSATWSQIQSASWFGTAKIKYGVGPQVGTDTAFAGSVDAFELGISGTTTVFDFEPQCTATCWVDAAAGDDANTGQQADPLATIQAGIDAVQANGTVNVRPGAYDETAASRSPVTIGGTYDFGLFLGAGKDGVTVQGVTAGDVPITSAAAVQAHVTTNSDANFGPDGVFVEADDVTIRGLAIGQNNLGQNKTIEVLGDGFTLDANDIEDYYGSVYFNDPRYDGGSGTPYIDTYTITNNHFRHGVSLDITSGTGGGANAGPISGRVISGNTFDGDANAGDCAGPPLNCVSNEVYWPAISFNGAGTTVPWFVGPVGSATITGNTFGASDQYIRHRHGAPDSAVFPNWASFWSSNTFARAALATTDGNPANVASYSYATSYSFPQIERIGGTIQASHATGCAAADCQGELDHTPSGGTLLLSAGTWNENVTVTNPVTITGASTASTIIDAPVSGAGVGIDVGAINGLTVQDLSIIDHQYGIRLASGGQTISNVTLEDLAVTDNAIHGIWSQANTTTGLTVNRVDASRNNQAGGSAGRGIWLINGHKEDVSITDGTFSNNGLVGIDVSDGEVTDLTISGNVVAGNGDSGIGVLGAEGPGANVVANNIVTNNGRFGIEVKIPDGNGAANGPGSVVVRDNVVTRTVAATDARDHAGIAVLRRSAGPLNAAQPDGVWVSGNTISGYHRKPVGSTGDGFGIVVEGTGNTVTGNTVSTNDVGVQIQGANPSVNAQSTAWFDRGDASSGAADVTRNAITGNGAGLRLAGTGTASTAECNWWGAPSGPSAPGGPGTGDSVAIGPDFTPWLLTSNLNGSCSLPTVSIAATASIVEGNAGTTTLNVPVTLSAPIGAPVTVQYSTTNGTADAPNDFTAVVAGTVTIPAGQTTGQVSVSINGGTYDEYDETFSIGLVGATNATIGAPSTSTATIVNDDTPTMAVAVASQNVVEGDVGLTTVNVVVTLNNPSVKTITAAWATTPVTASGSTDFVSASGVVTFFPHVTTVVIPVQVKGDTKLEKYETFRVGLAAPVNATLGASLTTVQILNDDKPRIVFANAAGSEGGNIVFKVKLSHPYYQAITVGYSAAPGTAGAGDFTLAPGSVVFAAGTTGPIPVTVTVPVDGLVEGAETFTLTATSPSVVAPVTRTGTIKANVT